MRLDRLEYAGMEGGKQMPRAGVADRIDEVYRRDLRALIARELHDGPIRELTGCVLRLEAYRSVSENPQMQLAISQVEEHARAALMSLRRIIGDLRDEAPEEDLRTAIESMIERSRSSSRAELTLVTSPAWPELMPGDVALNLLRVAQEAVNNALRHGDARHILLELTTDENLVAVTVSDDGKGIPAGTLPGTGIIGMRERAALLGGRLIVRGRQPGTEVRIEAPL
jgi:two-component system sensor histidine kinase UhpB